MKFGKNLAHLLIPEWKVYNFDYNDLKASIRTATLDPSPRQLKKLAKSFKDNFEYLNLFLLTKYGELSRKIVCARSNLELILQQDDHPSAKYEDLINFRFEVTSDISLVVRKLTKFILVQKIAVKKIFKKLLKHYPDQQAAKKLIATLSHTLFSDPSSFVCLDLSPVTSDLSSLLDLTDREIKSAHNSLHRKYVYSGKSRTDLHKSSSFATIKSSPSSILSETPSMADSLQSESALDKPCKFDAVSLLKKNFYLHCLLPKDITLKNDLHLSIGLYWAIPKIKELERVSTIYLSQSPSDPNPSFIVASELDRLSLVVAYTGGLRKYSYCSLPNHVVSALLQYLQASDEQTQIDAEHRLSAYLSSENMSMMTTLTLNALVSNNLTPSLKVVCNRTRYFLHKNASQIENHEHNDEESGLESISPLSNPPPFAADSNTVLSTTETKNYEDNYYMMLDEDIYTSCDVGNEVSFEVDGCDPFPFNVCSFQTNDTNLHNFDRHLKTSISENVLSSSFKPIALKKMPVKVQNFLLDGSVHPFKDFSLFDYMTSCYFNVIPENPNNHYSKLLQVDLLKNFENVQLMNHLNNYDQAIIQERSRMMLNRQMSCKSLRQKSINDPQTPETPQTPTTTINPNDQLNFDDYLRKFSDDGRFDEENDEDMSYFFYLSHNVEMEETLVNKIILSMIRSKQHIIKSFKAVNFIRAPLFSSKEKLLLPMNRGDELNYDSMNDDRTYLDDTNEYEVRFMNDYDTILAFAYFIMCFTSLFISGINFGIIFGILKLQEEEVTFTLANNVVVCTVLIFGFLFSLTLSMVSINLNMHRFHDPPALHAGIIWAGFAVVTVSILWTLLIVLV